MDKLHAPQEINDDMTADAWRRDGLRRALLLPESVRVVGIDMAAASTGAWLKFVADTDTEAGLPASLRKASIKRKTEYLAGRHCAVSALRAAGCAAPPMPGMGQDGLPLWPAGWLGSITHSNGEALAAVGSADRTRLLGIDVERLIDPASVAGIGELVATERELGLFSGLSLARFPDFSASLALTILFSAKESLYKALYPEAGRFMDFSAARAVALAPGVLQFRLTENWHPAWPAGTMLPVRYAQRGDRIYTSLHLAQPR